LGVIGFYDLPLTWLDNYLPALQAVTPSQVNDALRRRLQPEKLTIIRVGPKVDEKAK
jgi:zinc protease